MEGGELPEGAVPVEVSPGDCIIHSRCVVHGSLPNLSQEQRVTLYVGWFPWSAVSHNTPEVVRGRRRAITTAVSLRSAQAEFAEEEEEPFDTTFQQGLMESLADEAVAEAAGAVAAGASEAEAVEIFSAPTLGLLPVV